MTAQVGAVCVRVYVCVFVSCSLCRLIVVSCAILLVCVLVSCISRNTIGNTAPCRYCLSFALYAFKVQPLFLHLLRASEFACSAYISFSTWKVVNVMVCVFRGLVYTLTYVPLFDSHLVRCIYELSLVFSFLLHIVPWFVEWSASRADARKVPYFIVPARLCILSYSILLKLSRLPH